ncbi:hypothetical protein MMC25_001209 [Agyrium rufum]|nr:hypothetical protein [Agyrium rufum]
MSSPKSASKQPMNWDDYEYGRSISHGSFGSNASRVQFDDHQQAREQQQQQRNGRDLSDRRKSSYTRQDEGGGGNGGAAAGEGGFRDTLRHRRSSISMRINSIAQIGGVNSIERFAASWKRASGFYELSAGRPPFVVYDDGVADGAPAERIGRTESDRRTSTVPQQRSLLSQQIRAEGTPPDAVFEDEDALNEEQPLLKDQDRIRESSAGGPVDRSYDPSRLSPQAHSSNDVFSSIPYLSSPFATSQGAGVYGSLTSNLNESSRRYANQLFQEQQERAAAQPIEKGDEPDGSAVMVRRVERTEDGKVVQVIVGRSTLPQTVLNSVNTLIGIGLLSLPLAFKYAGWLIGVSFLIFSALATRYTATLLGKCLQVDPTLVTFSDLAYVSYGPKARLAVSVVFTFELGLACVALVVLFGDSLNILLPVWGVNGWKVLCGLIMLPLTFVPFRYLSLTSVLGIACCMIIILLVFVDGLIKGHSPGSLREPATTYLLPNNWFTLPLSFGLLMSPWGGHSVFPNVYRDMRHPQKYNRSLRYTFGFTLFIDLTMAIIGLLMFGEEVRDELTSNILGGEGYPRGISIAILVMIAIIPLTKLPLNSRPIILTLEIALGLHEASLPPTTGLTGMSGLTRGIMKYGIRIFIVALVTVIAIVFPAFDRIMALMGSAMCFTICIILPLAFYLKLFGRHISAWERIMDWCLIGVSSVLAVVGTVWAFLPRNM